MTIFAHRPFLERDRAFVVDAWCDSYRTAYFAGLAPMGEYIFRGADYGYRAVMVAHVYGIMARPGCHTLMAYRPSEQDPAHELAGFLCYEDEVTTSPRRVREAGRFVEVPGIKVPLVHYAYTKETYRLYKRMGVGEGVARGLFRAAGIDLSKRFAYTHKTPLAAQLVRTHAPLSECNPLYARYPNGSTQDQP